jgi:activator of HSP90 ATPase
VEGDRNRQTVSNCVSRREILFAGGATIAAAMLCTTSSGSEPANGISRSAESIHQEVGFTSSPRRVYEALTESKPFDRVVQLSGVMQSAALAQMKTPTHIGARAGEAFAIFGGYITGRQIELVPSQLIVQAWRLGSWNRGVYSIARFALLERGAGTTLQFDHTGFPVGEAEHLAAGWQEHYWDPLQKYLAEG